MTEHHYEPATRDDAAAIFDVLEKVAAEVPVLLDSHVRKELVLAHILKCTSFGESWVARGRDNQVVAFLLVEPDLRERFHHDNQALHLSYGGVTVSHRGQHIFPELVAKIMAKELPLTATVKRANKADAVGRLLKLGFTKVRSTDNQDDLRWQP